MIEPWHKTSREKYGIRLSFHQPHGYPDQMRKRYLHAEPRQEKPE